jgi:2-keto-4-pentenoate hydratase/2-oxohepta-3-ene-1,7-dioic acid hydratase in catechol pathway
MRLRTSPDGVLIADRDRWVSLAAALQATGNDDAALAAASADALALLRAEDATRAAALEVLEQTRDDASVARDPATAGLPFAPRSLRAFMLYESHVIASSRMLVKHFFPAPAWKVVGGFERVTGRTFPKLKPNARFWAAPTMYMANHTMTLADGDDMWWPSHTRALDFELELAFVLRKPLIDATPEEALDAVGGWLVLNDWSARDVQADDARENIFGPVIKSKTFANSIGCDVVTPDELGDWQRATGRVRVDGEVWCEGTTAGAAHDVGAMLAYASAGERLDAGDVFSTGTMPGCCGLELERFPTVGQTVELEIDGVGTVGNRIVAGAQPTTAIPA